MSLSLRSWSGLSFAVLFLAGASVAQAGEYDSDPSSTPFTRTAIRYGADDLTFQVSDPVYSVTSSIQRQQVSVPDYSCTSDYETNYTAAAWGGYFETTDSQKKISILKNLIKGVGKARATDMVADGIFTGTRPPGTWEKFVSRLKYADTKIQGIYNDVVVKYGDDNRKALGYTNCTQSGSHDEYLPVLVKTRSNYPVRTAKANVHIRIEGNPALLKGEIEIFSVSFNGADMDADLNITSEENAYTVEFAKYYDDTNTFYFKVSGSRLKAQPNNDLDLNAWNEGGQLVVQVTDKDFDAETYQRSDIGQPKAHIVVKQVNQGFANLDKTIGELDCALNRDNAVTKCATNVRPGTSTKGTFKKVTIPGSAKAKVSKKWSGSAFYSESASSSKDTQTVGGFGQ